MPIHTDRIRDVLRRPGFEGPQQLRGHIPCNLAPDGPDSGDAGNGRNASALSSGRTANYYGGPNPARYLPIDRKSVV